MLHPRLRAASVALILWLGLCHTTVAQSALTATAASGQIQFPQIPLRREVAGETPAAESAAWAALFLLAVGAAGFVVVRRGSARGLRRGFGWKQPGAGHAPPNPVGRVPLSAQASLHVVEWHGEELLLGCTPQSVTVLARRATEPRSAA